MGWSGAPTFLHWLVVQFHHLEKYEFVNGMMIIPCMKWKIRNVWNHQPVVVTQKKIDDNLETWKSGTHHRTNILEPLFGIFWVTLIFNPIEIYIYIYSIYIYIIVNSFWDTISGRGPSVEANSMSFYGGRYLQLHECSILCSNVASTPHARKKNVHWLP